MRKKEEWGEISGKKIQEAWRVALTFLTGGERSTESANLGDPTERGLTRAGPARRSLVKKGERASQSAKAML